MKVSRFKTVPGTSYGTPKEVWGFRTRARRGRPEIIARDFLKANHKFLALEPHLLRRTRVIESLGAHHIIHQQRLHKVPIHRAYVTVHLDRNGRVYLVKNRAVPRELLQPSADFEISKTTAWQKARRSVTKKPHGAIVIKAEPIWFPLKSKLRPAYKVRVRELKPRGDWLVFVDAKTGLVLGKYDNLASASGVADVFDPSPVIALGGTARLLKNGKALTPPSEAYTRVTLRDLDNTGHLDGRRVTTNTTKGRVQRKDRRFIFTSDHPGFEEVMAYFHIDRAIRYLESMGYRGPRAIFNEPLPVDANGTKEDNAWYSPHDRSLTFGLGGIDEAEDAEIILHELGHAIQDAICPGFGQSAEAAAMGEGFGDYFAASFFAEKKTRRYQTLFASWDGIEDGLGDPPFVRRLNEGLTYESFDHSDSGDEHDNGQIWSATLWEVRSALGRDIADRIILEGHFQLDGFTTFARGARAIIDADRNLHRGRHVARLRTIFHLRGIGPVE
ncbi:MAG TPA: M36 family metallopeptidase [Pyrinomonadaceae bacterium]|jgi:Zn-dependent metalloprotease|nr:M36 family metallopeptidase [Pyrinomonadaceae bacterium]